MLIKQTMQTIELANGYLPPNVAAEIIEALVNERIQVHNIQMLRSWESNHGFDSAPYDQKMKAIKAQREKAKALIAEALERGIKVSLKARIEVHLAAQPFDHDVSFDLTFN
ncbi:MAG: hypothetical protein U0U46_11290 [Saprospiraceae bacterium]|nr:hypothetical protein [Saprospiraceae bacterium]